MRQSEKTQQLIEENDELMNELIVIIKEAETDEEKAESNESVDPFEIFFKKAD